MFLFTFVLQCLRNVTNVSINLGVYILYTHEMCVCIFKKVSVFHGHPRDTICILYVPQSCNYFSNSREYSVNSRVLSRQ